MKAYVHSIQQAHHSGRYGIHCGVQSTRTCVQTYAGRRAGGCDSHRRGDDIVLRMTQLNLSARAYHRIRKLARTIGDPGGERRYPVCAFGGGIAVSSQVDAQRHVIV